MMAAEQEAAGALTDHEMTAIARRVIVADRGAMFRRAAAIPQGRVELHKHRRIALARLKIETDPAEAGWAAWMLRALDAALKPRKPRATPRARKVTARTRSHLERIKQAGALACNLLEKHAWESGGNQRAWDCREAYLAAHNVRRLAAVLQGVSE